MGTIARPTGALRLGKQDRVVLALWAAGCTERTLALFEVPAPGGTRPRETVEALQAFALTPRRECSRSGAAAG